MNNTLISRLAVAQWAVVILGVLLFLFLAVQFPETVGVRDSVATAAEIEGASSITVLRQIAARLAFLGHGATVVSGTMFAAITLVLCLFVALSLLNLIWLRKLRRLHNENTPPLPPANSRQPLCSRRFGEIRCSLASSRLGPPAAVAEGGRYA